MELPVYVVEDHDAALPLIYRAIGAKRLPLSGIALVHFDAHPDLLSPDIKASECTDKEKLFAFTSIAHWILPAIFMGHIGCVVWLKPPWAKQITEGLHQLRVGREKESGLIRVGTPLPYFISELLYVPELEDEQSVPLHVITIHPVTPEPQTSEETCVSSPEPDEGAGGGGGGGEAGAGGGGGGERKRKAEHSLSSMSSKRSRDDGGAVVGEAEDIQTGRGFAAGGCGKGVDSGSEQTASSKCIITKECDLRAVGDTEASSHGCRANETEGLGCCAVLREVLGTCRAWVLDFDLDFFSTENPFTSAFSKEQYMCLQRLYQLAEPPAMETRGLQLQRLQEVWSGSTEDALQQSSENECDCELMRGIRSLIGTEHEGAILDYNDIHMAGMMTDLPSHRSSEQVIKRLVLAARNTLCSCSTKHPPAIVTVARSTIDGYTPQDQVEAIQRLVLDDIIHTLFPTAHTHHLYLDQYCQILEPDSD